MIIANDLSSLVSQFSSELLDFHQGLEKEGLRVVGEGRISTHEHHKDLGHKLTHPYITTDYAENLLEFISPVFNKDERLTHFIEQIHLYTFKNMYKDESIWSASMPALLPQKDFDIPLAYYGESFPGKLKTLYRSGLGYRYGRSMQAIAGVHFNFSFAKSFIIELFKEANTHEDLKEFQDDLYFKLIRNFRRTSFILPFLFGASPVVDESFLNGKEHELKKLAKNTFGREFGTSLRMGGLGYTSEAQKSISICYNQLPTYIKTLETARLTSYPEYEDIKVKVDGEYRQLNTNLLQIDNEFYSTIRPKHVALSGESALQALHRGGVEYIEVRLMDLNPYALGGINEEGIRFLQHYLTYCLSAPSEVIEQSECDIIDQNFKNVVIQGRDPKSQVHFNGKDMLVTEAVETVLNEMEELSNKNEDLKEYFQKGIDKQRSKLANFDLLPSQRMLNELSERTSFVDHINNVSKDLKLEALKIKEDEKLFSEFALLKGKSFEEEQKIYRSQSGDFDMYLENYFKQIRIDK